jgi:alcohol dehydrogenase class IV
MVGFFTAPSIAWGTAALEQLSGLGARRAAVVVDPAVAAREGPRRVAEELEHGGATVTVVHDRPTSTRTDEVVALASYLRGFDPDWIVAVGGGTTIDATKGARLLLERPGLTLEKPPIDLAVPGSPRSRLAAVPTTSGSGAEASWAVDLAAPDGTPVDLADRSLVPDWAIVDARFAEGLSRAELVAGAFEAAALACEAYLSAWANPFSDALAVDVVRTVVRRLPHALRWSDDPDVREALHAAATMAGLAQSNAQRGIAHALARALVRPTGLGYATLLGVALPTVLEFDRPAARERLEALAEALRTSDESSTPSVAERFRRLASTCGLPSSLRGAGVPPEVVARERSRIVADTLRSPAVLANPRVPSAGDVEGLLQTLAGAPDERSPPAVGG